MPCLARFISLAAALAAVASPARAGVDRLVAPAGSDVGDCITDPCRTLGHALRQSRDGDRVVAAAGVYSRASGESLPLLLDKDVVLSGEPGAEIHDDGPGPATVYVTRDMPHREPCGVEGFVIDGGGTAAGDGVLIQSVAAFDPMAPRPFVRRTLIRGFAGAAVRLRLLGCCAGRDAYLGATVERNELRACGVGVAVSSIAQDDTSPAVDESLVRNNVIAGCSTGIELATYWDLPLTGPVGNAELRTELVHNTVSAAGDGVRILVDDARPGVPAVRATMANCIVTGAGRGVHEDPSGAFPLLGDVTALAGNDFFANQVDYWDAVAGPVNGAALNDLPGADFNLAEDPQLDGDWRLLPGSPCVDAAVATPSELTAPEDFEGQGRPVGPGPDIGADEVVAALHRGEASDLDPLTPPRAVLFPTLPAYLVPQGSPLVDVPPPRPLVVYAFPESAGRDLKIVKGAGGTVVIWF